MMKSRKLFFSEPLYGFAVGTCCFLNIAASWFEISINYSKVLGAGVSHIEKILFRSL